ncbi:MAG TPA: DNA primase, partial [Gammaproteobacteria bacterium]|nr:DNA primase [Gammaproteobacteria bacterium]
DIVEVIDTRVPLKKAGREYQACCPFHNEKTPSFTVSPAKQFYHCFGCGAHGTALGFLMEYEHLPFPEAVEALAHTVGLEVPRQDNGRPARSRTEGEDLYALMTRCDQFYRQQLRSHAAASRAVDYLKRRGVSGEIAAEYGMGFAPPGWDNLIQAMTAGEAKPDAVRERLVTAGMVIRKDDKRTYDRFRDRIMFPIRDRRGRTIAFGGRIIDDGEPKYLNSPETPIFHKGRELYGLYEATHALRKITRLLVVEGYMDVVALAQFGVRYAVATLGTATTREHLTRLFRLTPEVVFCFDGDRAGRDAAWRALQNALPVMQEGFEIRFMFLPEGEDPDSYIRRAGREAFETAVADAQPLSSYFFDHLQDGLDMASLEGRGRLVKLAQPLLAQLPGGVFRQMMYDQLARLSGTRVETLLANRDAGPPAGSATSHRAGSPPRSRSASRRAERGSAPTRTPVRSAIQALLSHPELADQAGDPARFASLDIPGVPLLISLLETLQGNPGLSPGALLERYRENPDARHLSRLLEEASPLGATELEADFVGALAWLEAEGLKHLQERLLAQGEGQLTAAQLKLCKPVDSLSSEEKDALKQLFND